MQYKVYMTAFLPVDSMVEVEAETEQEAIELAYQMSDENKVKWTPADISTLDDIEVTAVEATELH